MNHLYYRKSKLAFISTAATAVLSACGGDDDSGNIPENNPVAVLSASVERVEVSPAEPQVGEPITITVYGERLAGGYVLQMPGCTASELPGGTDTRRSYTCIPTQDTETARRRG